VTTLRKPVQDGPVRDDPVTGTTVRLPLAGVRLADARSATVLDLGTLRGVHVLTLIRHRY
jgi:hypothetical protein